MACHSEVLVQSAGLVHLHCNCTSPSWCMQVQGPYKGACTCTKGLHFGIQLQEG